MAHIPSRCQFTYKRLAGALVFNPSFKRALESGEDEPLGNKRVKVTKPQNLSPRARQVHDNNEQGMELINRLFTLKKERRKWTRKHVLPTPSRYAVCFSALAPRIGEFDETLTTIVF